jgi:exopolyphosphatase/pppGpp-phosphohydrolase
MNMVATAKLRAAENAFECLRCGHTETRNVETQVIAS